MVEKMDRVYSEFIDYLLYRIDALKKENRQLKMELSGIILSTRKKVFYLIAC